MTQAEFETIIKNAAHENDQLRSRVDTLEMQLAGRREGGESHQSGAIDNNALCMGCYRWRLTFAALVGVIVFVVCAVVLSLREGATNAIGLLICTGCAVTPGIETFIDWKWRLYKHGYAGTFRAVAEMWAAYKKGLGR